MVSKSDKNQKFCLSLNVMAMKKELFECVVSNAFKTNETDIISAFINTYNRNFDYEHIYDVMGSGEFGLEGFVKEGGVDLQDLGDILQTYLNDTRYHYCAYNGDGFYVHLQDVLNTYIDRMYDYKECLDEFVKITHCYNVMDTTNSHAPSLVERINRAWLMARKEDWSNILYALALRDCVELEEKCIEVLTRQDAYDKADQILMRVCDDNDLKVILGFLGW